MDGSGRLAAGSLEEYFKGVVWDSHSREPGGRQVAGGITG